MPEANRCESDDEGILGVLEEIFGSENVESKWKSCSGSRDYLTNEMYCPEPDFVVGPFNNQLEIARTIQAYRESMDQYGDLFNMLFIADRNLERQSFVKEGFSLDDWMEERTERLVPNENPRCFVAIELERFTTEKHRLGGMVHASCLGMVGVLVTSEERYLSSMKIRRYLRFLVDVGKTGDRERVRIGKNLILLPRNEFVSLLQEYAGDLQGL